jgi:hypothetical protein
MDNMFRDGLCSVGLLYLILHLWHSIGSIRKGAAPDSTSALQSASDPSRHVGGPPGHPALDIGSDAQEELSQGRFDRF